MVSPSIRGQGWTPSKNFRYPALVVGNKYYLGGVGFFCRNTDSFGFLWSLKYFLVFSCFLVQSVEEFSLEGLLEEGWFYHC